MYRGNCRVGRSTCGDVRQCSGRVDRVVDRSTGRHVGMLGSVDLLTCRPPLLFFFFSRH